MTVFWDGSLGARARVGGGLELPVYGDGMWRGWFFGSRCQDSGIVSRAEVGRDV